MALDFAQAREAVTRHLNRLYVGERENPTALGYGFDVGDAWAPMVDWDGVVGVFVWIVDKETGDLTPLSFPEWEERYELPLTRVGDWPS